MAARSEANAGPSSPETTTTPVPADKNFEASHAPYGGEAPVHNVFRLLTIVLVVLEVCTIGALVGVAVWAGTKDDDCSAALADAHAIGHWKKVTPSGPLPPARLAHAACPVGSDTMYIHGGMYGFSNTSFADIWRYTESSDSWVNITATGDIPPARLHHSMVNVDNQRLIVFGGFNFFNTVPEHDSYSDMYSLDLSSWVWSRLDTTISGAKPTKRGAHDAVYIDGTMYVFGGFPKITVTGHSNEFWAYDVTQNTWTDLTPGSPTASISALTYPSGRIGFAWAVMGSKAYMFGGGCPFGAHTSDGQCNDMWVFDTTSKTWAHEVPTSGEHPLQRRATHADAAVHGIMYLFGGVHINVTASPPAVTLLDDFHAWDPVADHWFEIHPNWGRGDKPPKTFGHSVVNIGEKIVVFGGRTNAPTSPGTNQLWEYRVIPPQ